jgi:hypothetical protein
MHALFTIKEHKFLQHTIRIISELALVQFIISTHYKGKEQEGQTNVASTNRHVQFEMKISICLKGTMAMVQENTKQCFPAM